MREDRCPGVLALHGAPDGWLARVRLPGGRLTCAQLRALADVAAGMGNDLVQLTVRANVQVRGLRAGAGEELAARLAAAGLLPSRAHERVRNVLASPLAGRHPDSLADVDELVARLDRELCADAELARLPRRFLFLVEDGSRVLDGYDHDVALVAVRCPGEDSYGEGRSKIGQLGEDRSKVGQPEEGTPGEVGRRGTELALLVAGLDSGRRVPAGEAPTLALAAARLFLARRGDAWRVRDLPGGARAVIDALGDLSPSGRMEGRVSTHPAGWAPNHPPPPHPRRREAALVWAEAPGRGLASGRTLQRDGRVALTALAPQGRLDSAQLRALADIGAEVRVSPWRTLSLVDLPDDSPAGELAAIGLVLDPGRRRGAAPAYAGRQGELV